jgi:hypothetical protein
MKFTYRSGDRPLEGYVLKRGVGKGGFGEVYFAVSDGGKEVALKLLRGPTDVEIRGVANCLNLKHPNLVHVYDLKKDGHGDAWLVMEYVLGESLAQVLNRHPSGLPRNLVKDWFGNLARAVGFLHDHGVVHRDLKPANVFVENGQLKVGDYGLCKALGASHRPQTRTVGTVHYMAPEVGTGNYNRQIDVYACGIILYEMLTGELPFDGESDGEILMKHLTANVDLGKVPGDLRAVVAKALDKNPARRYSTMADFARAVEGGTVPAPDPVRVAAEPPPVVEPDPDYDLIATPVPTARLLPPPSPPVVAKPVPPATVRDRLTDLTGALSKSPFVVALALVPYAVVTQSADWPALGKLFVLTVLVTWGVLVGTAGCGFRSSDTWGRRQRLGLCGLLVGAGAFWLDGWDQPHLAATEARPGDRQLFGTVALSDEAAAAGMQYLLYFGGAFAATRWWRAAAKDRKERFGLFPLFAAGFWGGVLVFLWPWAGGSPVPGGVVPLVIAAAAVQAVSPWVPPPPPPPKKLKWRKV